MPGSRRLLSPAGASLALLLAGCVNQAPTSAPSVTVHVVNGLSNVIVMSGDLSVATGLQTPPPGGLSLLSSCGGEADVQAAVKNGSGGELVLQIDPSAALDQAYARGDMESSSTPFSVEIIWSSGELNAGDWVVVAPGGVTRTTTPPASMPSGTCGAWIGEPKPS